MPIERVGQPQKQLAEFVRFSRRGQSVAGRVAEFRNSSNGPFFVFKPVIITGEDGKITRYHSAAVGLTADLRAKCQNPAKEIGHFLSITYVDSEATKRGQDPRKIFRVLELSREEMLDLASTAFENSDEVYKAPQPENDAAARASDDDDEMPF